MSKGPLDIFLFNGCESEACRDAHTYLADLLEIIQVRVIVHEPELKGKEVNVIITNSAMIEQLNSQFRKVDSPTDVLAFPPDEDLLGEVWLCPSIIRKNAKKFDQEYEKELVRVLIHGLLHIAGHDHEGSFSAEDDEQMEPMFKVQESILSDIEGQ